MKPRLLEEILERNESFDRLVVGVEKLVPFFQRDLIQHARSDVEIARVHGNREFFGHFETRVKNDARWAYKFQRAFNQKVKDPDDTYLEVRNSEERKKQEGVPSPVIMLPD